MEASALHAPVHAPPTRSVSARLPRMSLSGPLLRLRSDDQLVALFRAGEEEAFAVIHDRYRQRLLAYARQMLPGSPQDAEDAMQDVFLRAYDALRSSARPVALRAWLYRIAHNRCIDQMRRPQVPVDALADVLRPPLQDPPAEAQQREDLRQLVRDVGALPDQQRSALLMRELEGLSYADTATALGVTLPAVKSLLVRARMGLVQASEARDTACVDIRHDLVSADGRGVRATARTRRHLRECDGCRTYRRELRSLRGRLAAIAPPVTAAGPLGLLAKLTGLGSLGGGSGVTAAGGIASGGATAGGAATAVTVTKVCAVVCSIAVTGAGAVEVGREVSRMSPARAPATRIAPAPTPAPSPRPEVTAPTAGRTVTPAVATPPAAAPAAPAPAPAPAAVIAPSGDPALADDGADSTGGFAAPSQDEQAATPATETLPEPPPDATAREAPTPPVDPVASPVRQAPTEAFAEDTSGGGAAPTATSTRPATRSADKRP